MRKPIPAPFPWFGGKRRVADEVWRRFGDVQNYVEPFFGSGAVLLGRPYLGGIETVNDLDGYVANFWRALKADPEQVAEHADWPVHENDLHARHAWLVQRREALRACLEGDPEYYDVKIAGWWCWGICCWIGSGFCSGNGPWAVDENRQLVRLGNDGRGVKRQLVHLGNNGMGVNRTSVGGNGAGVQRSLPHLFEGRGIHRKRVTLIRWFAALAERLRDVRVCSGDWSRVCGPTATYILGTTGVFLDPPYSDAAERDSNIYTQDDLTVARAVREWAIAQGSNPLMRIALCSYGEAALPKGWQRFSWAAHGGYGVQRASERNNNRERETIDFSPHCLVCAQASLFEQPAGSAHE